MRCSCPMLSARCSRVQGRIVNYQSRNPPSCGRCPNRSKRASFRRQSVSQSVSREACAVSEYAEWGWAVRDSAKFRALYSSPSFNLALGQQHTEVSSQGEGQGTRRLSSAVPAVGSETSRRDAAPPPAPRALRVVHGHGSAPAAEQARHEHPRDGPERGGRARLPEVAVCPVGRRGNSQLDTLYFNTQIHCIVQLGLSKVHYDAGGCCFSIRILPR